MNSGAEGHEGGDIINKKIASLFMKNPMLFLRKKLSSSSKKSQFNKGQGQHQLDKNYKNQYSENINDDRKEMIKMMINNEKVNEISTYENDNNNDDFKLYNKKRRLDVSSDNVKNESNSTIKLFAFILNFLKMIGYNGFKINKYIQSFKKEILENAKFLSIDFLLNVLLLFMLDASEIIQVSKYVDNSVKDVLDFHLNSIIFGYDDFNEKFDVENNFFLNINGKIINNNNNDLDNNLDNVIFKNVFSVQLIETESIISDASVLEVSKILSKFSLSIREIKKLVNIDWTSKAKNMRLYNKKFIADVLFLNEKIKMNTDDIYVLLENENNKIRIVSNMENAVFNYGNKYCVIKITSDIDEYQKIKKGETSIDFLPEYIEELINKYINLNF